VTKLPITLVIITLNEESNLERCLASVPFANEIVVVDSFSTDRTVEIAQKRGAHVFQEKWRGYGPQKAFATQQASNDWILSLDADEALSPELAAEIQSVFLTLQPEAGYEMPRRSFHLGRWIDHGGWYPDYQMRLFNKKHSQWNSSALHEKVEVRRQLRLQTPILHWVFADLSDQVVTNDRYSSLGAEQMFASGKRMSMGAIIFKLLTKPWSKFIENYFWKRGCLDGMPGFIIAVSSGYSIFLKFAKQWELQQQERLQQKNTKENGR